MTTQIYTPQQEVSNTKNKIKPGSMGTITYLKIMSSGQKSPLLKEDDHDFVREAFPLTISNRGLPTD